MLEPDARHLLLDTLRPPPRYTLDMAVGTTYSLDLLALMTAPVAFAMFDRHRDDGASVADPIATLQALREYAARITVFCQAGQITVPPAFRSLFVYLEGSVHPVVPPDADGIFHPKVWYIRFRCRVDDALAFRFLCLSRNLTFDRSWDTVLRLEGEVGEEPRSPELARFAESLVAMAERTRPVSPHRARAITELGEQFARANWTLPEGFASLRFWPLGDDGLHRWPFEGRRDRMLIVSPFVTQRTLDRLRKKPRGSILVSRPETFDALGGAATKHLAERLVLSPDAAIDSGESEVGSVEASVETIAESADHRLEGLHAKLYIADAGRRGRVWTGSANATDAAFHGNVEFLVELGGRKDRCGVHAAIGDRVDRLGLRKLVDAYEPARDQALEQTAIQDTTYYQEYFIGAQPIPKSVLVDLATRACLCRLDDYPLERSTIRDALLGLPGSPSGSGIGTERVRLAEQRRLSFALVLWALNQLPNRLQCNVDRDSGFRRVVWDQFEQRLDESSKLAAALAQWAALVAKDYTQDALSTIWSEFCRKGYAAQPADGMLFDDIDRFLSHDLLGEQTLDLGGDSPPVTPGTATRAFISELSDCLAGHALEDIRGRAVRQGAALSGLALLLLLRNRLTDRIMAPPEWRVIAGQSSNWQPGLLGMATALDHHLDEEPTLGDTLAWVTQQFIIDVHERVAYSKLPDFTFRFRWEEDRLRFYGFGCKRFEPTDIRLDAIARLSQDLGLFESSGDQSVLTADGRTFVAEVLG